MSLNRLPHHQQHVQKQLQRHLLLLRSQIISVCILLASLVTIANGFGAKLPGMITGILFGCALLLQWRLIALKTRVLSLILLSVGGMGILWGLSKGYTVNWHSLLSANTGIITMLVAVSFLSLIAKPGLQANEKELLGRRGFLSTLLGVHLFGSVINLSAAFIYGDRTFAKNNGLDRLQTLALVRGSTLAAFWSPFYASMAVALSYNPKADLSQLLVFGLPLALVGLLISFFELTKGGQCKDFSGYPLHLSTLWLPLLLAVSILLWHYQQPKLSVLLLISILVPIVSIAVLLISGKKSGTESPYVLLANHVTARLPKMCNEIALFLTAGVMTQSLLFATSNAAGWRLFATFGAWQAMLCLVGIVTTALLGLHPIIAISIVASMVDARVEEQTLLAMVFVAAWAIGTAVGPLSGINLALHGRYGIDVFKVMTWNRHYALIMLLLVLLFFYALY